MQQLDAHAPPYAKALVAALKQEGLLTQPLIEAAFLRVPRHAFLDRFYRRHVRNGQIQMQEYTPASYPDADGWLQAVYADEPLTIAYDDDSTATSSSSSPGAMAIMLEALELAPGLRVLEIGTGTGYNAALLAAIVGDPRLVSTVEIDDDLARRAAERLDRVVGAGVTVFAGDGLAGYVAGAPYDRLIATGSTSAVPLPWLEQTRPGGIILMNLIGKMGACAFLRIVKEEHGLAAQGQFLSASEFMELHLAGQYPRRRAGLVGRYIARPITTHTTCRRACFDPALLWDRRLHFALQLAFPRMFFASVYTNPLCPCLIDQATETMLLFRPTNDEHFQIEVRGDPLIWDRVLGVYQQWMTLEQPGVTAYQLHIDAAGDQVVTLAPEFLRGETPTWTLLLPTCSPDATP